jgi:hypothetical protein
MLAAIALGSTAVVVGAGALASSLPAVQSLFMRLAMQKAAKSASSLSTMQFARVQTPLEL